MKKQCERCGAPFEVKAKYPQQRFCGHRCAFLTHQPKVLAASKTPEARRRNGDALRGRGKGLSYIKRDGRHEHRIVAEQKLGRPLLPNEIAHHVDENKRNNAADNIDVLPSRAEHTRLHSIGKKHPVKTHCKRGHELSGDNLYVNPCGGRRVCIACRREYDNAWKKDLRRERGLQRPGPKPGTPGAAAISISNANRSKQQCA